MEKVGSVEPKLRLSEDLWLKGQLEELRAEVAGNVVRRGPAKRLLMALLIELEWKVEDDQRPVFMRMVAWFVLVSWWSVLPFDDACWMSPDSAQLASSSWKAWIARTKPTGQTKKVEGLYALVSQGARLSNMEWLKTGHGLWGGPLGEGLFMILPTVGLTGARCAQASYGDTLAMVRAVLSETVSPMMADFWTLHSPRQGLPAAAAACGAPADWIDLLDAWPPSTSQGYAEQRLAKVEYMQITVAKKIREMQGMVDFLGEEALLLELAEHGRKKKVTQSEINQTLGSLSYFAKSSGEASATPPMAAQWPSLGGACAGEASVEGMVPEVEEPAAKKSKSSSSGDGLVPTGTSGFAISISRREARRCLHYVGNCPRVPYVHYREAEELGEALPDPALYNAVCKDCWPSEKPTVPVPEADAEDVDGEDVALSADETSEEEEDEPAVSI